jgi:hypothetical protein
LPEQVVVVATHRAVQAAVAVLVVIDHLYPVNHQVVELLPNLH